MEWTVCLPVAAIIPCSCTDTNVFNFFTFVVFNEDSSQITFYATSAITVAANNSLRTFFCSAINVLKLKITLSQAVLFACHIFILYHTLCMIYLNCLVYWVFHLFSWLILCFSNGPHVPHSDSNRLYLFYAFDFYTVDLVYDQ